jgi:hypothetical protein
MLAGTERKEVEGVREEERRRELSLGPIYTSGTCVDEVTD